MNRIIKTLLFAIIVSSCNKDKDDNCTGESCLGQHSYPLTNNDKSYITIKDTIYKFINTSNDTIRLKFRKSYNEPYYYGQTCPCEDKSTDIHGECVYSVYTFSIKDIAIQYAVCNSSHGTTKLNMMFGDTNNLVNNLNSYNDSTSQFIITQILTKKNDLDSLIINGKYFYNVINTYDKIAGSSHPYITDCVYSKRIGVISFKYNNVTYSLVH